MMLSTKARRVSVGARAGNARRSALRRGCGERFRTWVGKAWPIARGEARGNPERMPEGPEPDPRGVGMPTPGNSVPKDILPTPEDAEALTPGGFPVPGNRESSRRRCRRARFGRGRERTPGGPGCRCLRLGARARPEGSPTPGNSAPGTACAAQRSGCGCRKLRSHRPESRPAKNSALSVSRPRRPRETTPRTSSVQAARGRPGQCLKPMTPGSLPFPRGWGPRTALPQDSATGAAAPGVPTRWAFPVPGNREDSPEGSGARPGETRNAYPRGSRRRRRGNSSGEPQPESGPEGVQTDSKTPEQTSLPRDFPKAQHPALNPRPRQAVSRQRPQEARRGKKRTKQFCSVRQPDCYSAALCAASARASASLARASASFRFAAASFSFASAS